MKLRDAAAWLPNHLDRVRRLGAAARPHARAAAAALAAQRRPARRVPRRSRPATLRWAVEVRDASWLHDDVFEVLDATAPRCASTTCSTHHPWIRTTDWTYVRFHGPNALDEKYVGRYGGRRLWRPAERLAEWADEGVDVYVYFNNDYGGAASEDATWFRRRIGPAARPRAASVAATTRSARATRDR